jgi:hemolysin III
MASTLMPLSPADDTATAAPEGAVPAAGTRRHRRQSAHEERLNALSHGLGFVAAAAAWPLLSDHAAQHGGSLAALGIAVFCLSAMVVYAASMIYHALPPGRAKHWAHRVDHAAIFVFIAGSYTPFALGPLRGDIGGPLLAGAWSVAFVGAGCKIGGRLRHPLASTALYAGMGWMALALLGPLAERGGAEAIGLLLAGGGAYTLGAVFFLFDHRLRYGHLVWHLFVLAGSACHVLAALLPLAPLSALWLPA